MRHHLPKAILASSLILSLCLGGCAVGPDFVAPDSVGQGDYLRMPTPTTTAATATNATNEVSTAAAQRFNQGADVAAKWWMVFQSEPLNALVEQALKANPTIPAAEAALRVAQETMYAQQGAFFPTVTAGLSPTRQKIAQTLASPALSGATFYNLHTAQLNISYAIDVFGGNRRQVEALAAQADYQRFQLEAARTTLSTNVVGAAVQLALLNDQIAATEASIRTAAEQLPILRKQLSLGAIPEANVIAQEALDAQARALLPPLQKMRAQQQDLLAALTGRFPNELPDIALHLDDLQLPRDLPVSLPSKLVEQRPDIRAAEEQLHAASAQIGVATAALLPQLTLTAGVGSAALRVADLFTSGTGFWSLAGGIAQPIFDGGALRHKKRAAEAAYQQAAQQYRATVLAAFQNVADTLHAIRADDDAFATAATSERATLATLKIARRQVELGDISYLSLLNAEQTYQQTRIALIQARANRFMDSAALFQALGGGWWNR